MKSCKITAPIILGLISIAEIVFLKQLSNSLVLWLFYGIYKVFLSNG